MQPVLCKLTATRPSNAYQNNFIKTLETYLQGCQISVCYLQTLTQCFANFVFGSGVPRVVAGFSCLPSLTYVSMQPQPSNLFAPFTWIHGV